MVPVFYTHLDVYKRQDKTFATNTDITCIQKEFKNWVEATERFKSHEKCAAYTKSVYTQCVNRKPLRNDSCQKLKLRSKS